MINQDTQIKYSVILNYNLICKENENQSWNLKKNNPSKMALIGTNMQLFSYSQIIAIVAFEIPKN